MYTRTQIRSFFASVSIGALITLMALFFTGSILTASAQVTLSNAVIEENTPYGSLVGTFSTGGLEASSGNDEDKFVLSGSNLYTKFIPDYEAPIDFGGTPHDNSYVYNVKLPFHTVDVTAGYDAYAALQADGSIIAWGVSNWGGSGAPTGTGYTKIYSNGHAFAALKNDGSIAVWGASWAGGQGTPTGTGYVEIYTNAQAFAALKDDGSITAWGNVNNGGSGAPTGTGYTEIYSNNGAFAALKDDGSIAAWGNADNGGQGAPTGTGYTEIYFNYGVFAALKDDGSIAAWGNLNNGGQGAPTGTGYTKIYSNYGAFAAVTTDGSITVWGNAQYGGQGAPTGTGYTEIYSTDRAFAAVTTDGSITVWGNSNYGGQGAPTGTGYTEIYPNRAAFAALKPDGSITAWGNSGNGGYGAPTGTGYTKVYSNVQAFAAIKDDGSITAWGNASNGGYGEPTGTGYTEIYSNNGAFAALKDDGSIAAWGNAQYGGYGAPDGTGYTKLYPSSSGFAATKDNGDTLSWGQQMGSWNKLEKEVAEFIITITDSQNEPTIRDNRTSDLPNIFQNTLEDGDPIGTLVSPFEHTNSYYEFVTGIGAEDNSRFSIENAPAQTGTGLLKSNFVPDTANPVDLGDTPGNNTYSIRVKRNLYDSPMIDEYKIYKTGSGTPAIIEAYNPLFTPGSSMNFSGGIIGGWSEYSQTLSLDASGNLSIPEYSWSFNIGAGDIEIGTGTAITKMYPSGTTYQIRGVYFKKVTTNEVYVIELGYQRYINEWELVDVPPVLRYVDTIPPNEAPFIIEINGDTAEPLTLTYDANGGTGTMADETHESGAVFNLTANAFTRNGYSFVGWNSQADGSGTGYADGASFTMPGQNTTIYAQWSEDIGDYDVEYFLQEGDGNYPFSPTETETFTGAVGSIVDAGNRTFTGYTYDASHPNNVQTGVVLSTETTVLKRYYELDASIDAVNDDFGTISGGVVTTTVKVFDNDTHNSGAIDLSMISFTYTPFSQTGIILNPNGTVTIEASVPAGYYQTDYAICDNAITGLCDEAIVEFEVTDAPTPTFTLTYNANGGTGTMADETHESGAVFNLTANAFTRNGYSFVGWNSQADGSGTGYADGASFTMPGQNTTIYAQWSEDIGDYDVEYFLQNTDGTYPGTPTETETFTGAVGSIVDAGNRTFTGYTYDASHPNNVQTGVVLSTETTVLKRYYTLDVDINAVDDSLTITQGNSGQINILSNDTFYGVNASQVIGSGAEVGLVGDVITGAILDTTTGIYSVPVTTPVGVYVQPYRLCAVSEAMPCDTANITITVNEAPTPTFTLTYNANGGTGTMADETHESGAVFNLTANAFTRNGYSFVGWNSQADGSGTGYADGALFTMPGQNTTIYAQWSEDTTIISICGDPNADNYDDRTGNNIVVDNSLCIYSACKDPEALNYDPDPNKNADNSLCEYGGTGGPGGGYDPEKPPEEPFTGSIIDDVYLYNYRCEDLIKNLNELKAKSVYYKTFIQNDSSSYVNHKITWGQFKRILQKYESLLKNTQSISDAINLIEKHMNEEVEREIATKILIGSLEERNKNNIKFPTLPTAPNINAFDDVSPFSIYAPYIQQSYNLCIFHGRHTKNGLPVNQKTGQVDPNAPRLFESEDGITIAEVIKGLINISHSWDAIPGLTGVGDHQEKTLEETIRTIRYFYGTRPAGTGSTQTGSAQVEGNGGNNAINEPNENEVVGG